MKMVLNGKGLKMNKFIYKFIKILKGRFKKDNSYQMKNYEKMLSNLRKARNNVLFSYHKEDSLSIRAQYTDYVKSLIDESIEIIKDNIKYINEGNDEDN